MLSDGSIIDSIALPPDAVESYPVSFTGASLSGSAAAQRSAADFNQSVTASGQDLPPAYLRSTLSDAGRLRTAPASGAGPYHIDTEGEPGPDLMGSEARDTFMDTGGLRDFSDRLPRRGPTTYSGALSVRSAPGSDRREPAFQYSSDSARRLAQDFPMTFSGVSMADTTAALSAMDTSSGDQPGAPPSAGQRLAALLQAPAPGVPAHLLGQHAHGLHHDLRRPQDRPRLHQRLPHGRLPGLRLRGHDRQPTALLQGHHPVGSHAVSPWVGQGTPCHADRHQPGCGQYTPSLHAAGQGQPGPAC